ncbi:MAG: tRNA lysidine(34) synthetase TilS [Bacteroidetes bacterium]|nr:MAG: tRNA lysidine(34) synthetase TilS [Bacteroidota bacterium]
MNIERELTKLIGQMEAGKARFIVAVSGGIDSMSLLHACIVNQLDIVVAHCNFNLRGDESDADMQLVIEFCQLHHIPFFIKQFNTKAICDATGKSVQETARQLRYQWFESLLSEANASYVLTAHHGNDLVETFLINACRGAGLKGLSSIPQVNGAVIRPWLFLKQEFIQNYAKANNVPFRHDASNDAINYTRNYIRHEVIPLLKVVNKQTELNLIDAIHHLKEASTIVNEKVAELKELHTLTSEDSFIIKHNQVSQLPYCNTLLHDWLKPYGFHGQSIKEASNPHQNTGSIWLSDHYQMLYNRGVLIITKLKPKYTHEIYIQHVEDQQITWLNQTIEMRLLSQPPQGYEKGKIYIDASLLKTPLTLRNWQEGDTFIPFGMTNFKKLSDFFTNLKLGAIDKHEVPILCSGDQILAVIPYRVDNRFRLRETTAQVLEISIN